VEKSQRKKANLKAFHSTFRDPSGDVGNLPLQLFLEVTTRCNLLCQKCLRNYSLDLKARDIPFSVVEQLGEFYEAAIQVNTFGFGEMFLYRDLARLVEILKKQGCKVTGITNGTMISREDVAWMVRSHFDELTFSIDGATTETMRRLRGADLNRIIEVLQFIKEEKNAQKVPVPRIVVNFVAQKDNLRELPDLVQLLSGLNIYFLGVNTLAHHLSSDSYMAFDKEHSLSNLSRKEVEGVLDIARSLAKNAGIELESYIDLDFEWSELPVKISIGETSLESKPILPHFYCLYPWTTLYLAADMTTKVCCNNSADFGDCSEPKDLDRIWHASAMLTEVRNCIRKGMVHPACRPCVEQSHYATSHLELKKLERDAETM
jgi:MoaA/NifB/PqqE/SkfB family radical SAM enzyme